MTNYIHISKHSLVLYWCELQKVLLEILTYLQYYCDTLAHFRAAKRSVVGGPIIYKRSFVGWTTPSVTFKAQCGISDSLGFKL